MSTPALDRATEALHPYWSERYPSGSQADDMARVAVSAALHDPEDPVWPLSALGLLRMMPENIRDWSPAMRDAYGVAATEHGFTAGNQAAQRVFMIESAAKLRAAILGSRQPERCAWCDASATRQSAHSDGRTYPSCGATGHGLGEDS